MRNEEWGEFRISTCSNFTFTLLRIALALATSNASADMSHAVTSASGISAARVTAMHPLPVPMSSSWVLGGGCWHQQIPLSNGIALLSLVLE